MGVTQPDHLDPPPNPQGRVSRYSYYIAECECGYGSEMWTTLSEARADLKEHQRLHHGK